MTARGGRRPLRRLIIDKEEGGDKSCSCCLDMAENGRVKTLS